MALADRVIARFETKTAGKYNPVVSKLVSQIDAWNDLAKDGGPVTKALEVLDKLEAMIKADDEWQSSEGAAGLNKYTPQQRIDELRDALHKGQRAAKVINEGYDDLNDSFLRMGLK